MKKSLKRDTNQVIQVAVWNENRHKLQCSIASNSESSSFLNIDVQGVELKALQGLGSRIQLDLY